MKRALTVVSVMTLMFVAAAAAGQSPAPKPAPEMQKWEIWVGKWTLSGTAKDGPTEPEHKLDWRIDGRWILGGFFAQVDHVVKGNGEEVHDLDILSYDPIKKIHVVSGFSDDGSTWVITGTFDNERFVENMKITTLEGSIATCRNTWVFSNDRMAVTGIAECEMNGVRWTAFRVKGTKAGTSH